MRNALVTFTSTIVLSACVHRGAVVDHGPSRVLAPPLTRLGYFPGVEPTAKPGGNQDAQAAPLSSVNLRVTQTSLLPEGETTIAINPTNPSNIIVGAIGLVPFGVNQYYSSSDGGQTWIQGAVPGQLNFLSSGDPSVTFCGDGTAYYASLVLNTQTGRSGLIVDRSSDGGLTWPDEDRRLLVDRNSIPSQITDKPWIICDQTSSAFAGRIYAVWTDPQLVPSGNCTTTNCRALKIKRSTDSGATWSAPVMVSDNPQTPQNWALLAIGPSGELYVSWAFAVDENDDVPKLKFDKSTNGGVTFGIDKTLFSLTPIADDPYFRHGYGLAMDADRSNGPYRGYIYIVFADGRNGDADILLVRSTDGGTTWSAPIRLNDDPIGIGADQWQPSIAVDPSGRVIVTFYDRRRFIGTEKYEIWGAISRDGGQTFDTNFLISDTPSDVTGSVFLGDYDGVAATSTRIYPTWADQRIVVDGDTPDIYTDAYANTFAYDEVKGVVWSTKTSLDFQPQDARFGVNLDYDVLGGLLSELRTDLGFTHAGCVAAVWPAPPFVDSRVPPGADGYYYVVRVHGPAGVGTYGDASPARPNPRDALDETLVTCP